MDDQREVGEIATVIALMEERRRVGVKPYAPLKRSRRSRLRYRWTMATERFRRSLARRIYDFEDGW